MLAIFWRGVGCFWHIRPSATDVWDESAPASSVSVAGGGMALVVLGTGEEWAQAARAVNEWTPAPGGQGFGSEVCDE